MTQPRDEDCAGQIRAGQGEERRDNMIGMKDIELTLNSPLTKEDWYKITDAEMEKTPSVTFQTPSGKEVEFVKVVRCKDCKYAHLTYDGDCKYCQLDIDRDYTESTYRNGNWFCADGEKREE